MVVLIALRRRSRRRGMVDDDYINSIVSTLVANTFIILLFLFIVYCLLLFVCLFVCLFVMTCVPDDRPSLVITTFIIMYTIYLLFVLK